MKTLTEEQLARLLVGKAVEISVAEPWDFEYPGRASSLRGRVVAVHVAGKPEDQSVRLELEDPFLSEEGPTVGNLLARRRHRLSEGMVEMLAAGERVSANLSYSDGVPEDARLPGVTPKLIGSVRLADL